MRDKSKRSAFGGLMMLLVAASACAGITRTDAIDELVGVGYTPESAECILSSVEDQGYEAADLADPLEPEVEAAVSVGVEACISSGDVANFVGENEDEIREQIIDGLVSESVTRSQAECVIDSVEADGYTLTDLAQQGLDTSLSDELNASLQSSALACLS